MSHHTLADRNQEATVWCGGLEPQATEELVWELMLQAGPVVAVNMPRDKITNTHQGYAFVEFRSPQDAEYAIRIMNMIKLFGKPLRVNKASKEHKENDIGANLFVGNLDPDVDDKLLYDTFSAFGQVLTAKVVVDQETGDHRGFGFVHFDSFEASDAAIQSMDGQYLCNQPVQVSYAYKKDGNKGERHGTEAERLLAASRKVIRPPSASSSMPHLQPQRAAPLPMSLQQLGRANPTNLPTSGYSNMAMGGQYAPPPMGAPMGYGMGGMGGMGMGGMAPMGGMMGMRPPPPPNLSMARPPPPMPPNLQRPPPPPMQQQQPRPPPPPNMGGDPNKGPSVHPSRMAQVQHGQPPQPPAPVRPPPPRPPNLS